MKIEEFSYHLPAERIAQRPPARRDSSLMLQLDRATGVASDHGFRELPDLLRGDELMVLNNARVIPARLFGRRAGSKAQPAGRQRRGGGEHLSAEIEVLLTRRSGEREWDALVRPGRKIGVGERILIGGGELEFEVTARGEYGLRKLTAVTEDSDAAIERLGHVPLPPYIRRSDEAEDRTRYQTIFAKRAGAVAAPTAGLHFTEEILDRIRARGVESCEITLDVGLGTFQPIHESEIEQHHMHTENYEIPAETAEKIRQAKSAHRPIMAIGTTVVRTLEDAARKAREYEIVKTGRGEATIYITPGFSFRAVDQLLTNFHLPKSSLLVLVSAFAGREKILNAYHHALESGYRFFSYGDCMLIR